MSVCIIGSWQGGCFQPRRSAVRIHSSAFIRKTIYFWLNETKWERMKISNCVKLNHFTNWHRQNHPLPTLFLNKKLPFDWTREKENYYLPRDDRKSFKSFSNISKITKQILQLNLKHVKYWRHKMLLMQF